MRRATITLSDELEAELEGYLAAQEVPPSLTSLMQAALRSFLAERRPGLPRGPWAGGAPPSEVAEEVAAYGAPPTAGGGSLPLAWAAPAGPRARDLPGLLAGLPHLSEEEARELADDLDRAREELEGAELHDPWGAPAPEGTPGARGGGVPEPGES